MSKYEELRQRTAREMGLAGNHWDAIKAHLDEYEAAYAHELAEKIRTSNIEESGSGVRCCGTMLDMAADLIDPRVED